mmetsp:Transcript_51957/g.116544  ORF Transcript_51957/g.116544 Transcript_51957/m.116544 type:complete len:200 (+) Transcript_51957:67-666(+)
MASLVQRVTAQLVIWVLLLILIGLVSIATVLAGPEHTTNRMGVLGALVALFGMMLAVVLYVHRTGRFEVPMPTATKVTSPRELTCIWASCTFGELHSAIDMSFSRVLVKRDDARTEWTSEGTLSRSVPVAPPGQKTCPCCLDEFHPQSAIALLPCGHIYHEECMVCWSLSSAKTPGCPTCRANFDFRESEVGGPTITSL